MKRLGRRGQAARYSCWRRAASERLWEAAFPCQWTRSHARAGNAGRGQATTEVVLLFPVFMFFLFAFSKIFSMLILVQKMEVASYYAARRWQLESHRNVEFEGDDSGKLQSDIETKVSEYLGFGSNSEKFLDLQRLTGAGARFRCERTQVWNVCTLTVRTRPIEIAWMYKSPGFTFEVTKYVPNRDRPIAFVLPGLQG